MQKSQMFAAFAVLTTWALIGPRTAHAQSLGTFRWQQQPYCNILSLTVTQTGAIYTLDGFDDQCGAATRAPLVGLATPNPDGTIGFGLNISTGNGQPVQVAATVTLAGLSGTWRDSTGQSGAFMFGASAPGSARPPVTPPAGGVTTGVSNTFTAPQTFAGGLNAGGMRLQGVGATAASSDATSKGYVDGADAVVSARIDAGDASLRADIATGDTASQALAAAGDAAVRAFAAAGDAATLAAAQAADVLIFQQLPPSNWYHFSGNGGFYFDGGNGTIPVEGIGGRVMWHPGKFAFRAGGAEDTEWDDANTGFYSVAFGHQVTAIGRASIAVGNRAWARGDYGVALGNFANANGVSSTAIGWDVTAGDYSTAIGSHTTATGINATVLGTNARAGVVAPGSFVYGDASTQAILDAGAPNQFMVRAAGGTVFFSNALMSSGVWLPAGGGGWLNLSDVARKQSFRDLDGETVLGKLRAMPVREWSYISQGDAIRHVGPTAQDFRAAFGLGEDPLGIGTVDADGIALAGVKALEVRTAAWVEEHAALRAELAALKVLVATLTAPRQ